MRPAAGASRAPHAVPGGGPAGAAPRPGGARA